MPSGMAKKRRTKWRRKACGCVKATLSVGPVLVRCTKHRGKPAKDGRVLCYFDGDGLVRPEK